MMTTPRLEITLCALALAATLGLSACGADSSGTSPIPLPPVAAEGRSLANESGCGACHGTSGQGGVGPAFTNLFGSPVELDDGSTVTADRQYLIESIKDPSAKKVKGFRLPMPTNRLTDDEIDQIVAYIEALAAESTS